MNILDFLLLAFAVTILSAVAAARLTGMLPMRGLRRSTRPDSMPQRHDPSGNGAIGAPDHNDFKGILVHHDGPVQFLQGNHTTS